MRKFLFLMTLTTVAAVATFLYFFNTSVDLPIRSIEKKLGLAGEHYWQFHRVLENKERHGFRFPGYLIGIEKASKKILGLEQQQDVFQTAMLGSSTVSSLRDAFNDSDRLFLSHLLKYQASHSSLPRITSKVMYSVYDEFTEATAQVPFGDHVLMDLRMELIDTIQAANYSHVLVISMGWNTPQLEAIGDINSLVGQLMNEVESKGASIKFKPLVIGITWPSKSSVGAANYLSKAYDADELGLVWVNKLINQVLLPVKDKTAVKVVMLGHSLGARALSMGLFASNWAGVNSAENQHVDAMIGYEPSFSINRFITGEGIEDSPYASFKNLGTQFIFTWSKHDLAMRIGRLYLTSHMGGEDAAKVAQKHPHLFQPITLGEDFSQIRLDPDRVVHLDASLLLKHQTHRSSGGAHSDIFRAELAAALWQLLLKLDE